MTSDGPEWTWKFAPRAADQFDSLDPHVQDRLACVLDHEAYVLEVHRIEHRSGAYTADD